MLKHLKQDDHMKLSGEGMNFASLHIMRGTTLATAQKIPFMNMRLHESMDKLK